jgi:hypothetical protein
MTSWRCRMADTISRISPTWLSKESTSSDNSSMTEEVEEEDVAVVKKTKLTRDPLQKVDGRTVDAKVKRLPTTKKKMDQHLASLKDKLSVRPKLRQIITTVILVLRIPAADVTEAMVRVRLIDAGCMKVDKPLTKISLSWLVVNLIGTQKVVIIAVMTVTLTKSSTLVRNSTIVMQEENQMV